MASKLNIYSAEFTPSSVIEPSPVIKPSSVISEPTPARVYTVTLEPDVSDWIKRRSESEQKFLLSKIEGFKRSATKEKYDIVVSIGGPYDVYRIKKPFRNGSIRYLSFLIDPAECKNKNVANMILGYPINRKDPEFAKAGDELMKEFSERTGVNLKFKCPVRYDGVFCKIAEELELYSSFYDKTDNITYALTYALTCAVAEQFVNGNMCPFWKLNHEIVKYLENKDAKYRNQFMWFADTFRCAKAVVGEILDFDVDLNAIYVDYDGYKKLVQASYSQDSQKSDPSP